MSYIIPVHVVSLMYYMQYDGHYVVYIIINRSLAIVSLQSAFKDPYTVFKTFLFLNTRVRCNGMYPVLPHGNILVG